MEYDGETLVFSDGVFTNTITSEGETSTSEHKWRIEENNLILEEMKFDTKSDETSNLDIYAYLVDEDTLIFIENKSCSIWELERIK